MTSFPSSCSRSSRLLFLCVFFLSAAIVGDCQSTSNALYDQLKAFQLNGGTAKLAGRSLQRDRVTITLDGDIYFTKPINGKVTGAVFIGHGHFEAPVPDSSFEKENVRRLLKADVVASDFDSAVFRFSDDTYEQLNAGIQEGAPPPEAQQQASEIDARVLKECGINLPSRIGISILNQEASGFFFANFRGGKLGNSSFIFDPQTRVPTSNFDLNAGEKGVIFKYRNDISSNDILMAFYSLADYQKRVVTYSDLNDLVDITHYDLEVDLRDPRRKLGLRTLIKMKALGNGIQAIPFSIGESLGESDGERLKKQMRVRSVKYKGAEIAGIQEDWESGCTVYLPGPISKGDEIELEMTLEGDFLQQPVNGTLAEFSYPRSNESWYPRHGFLDRSTFTAQFIHSKKFKVAFVGKRISENPSPENKDFTVTKYVMNQPVALVTFALGPFERYTDTIKWDGSDLTTLLEFNSVTSFPIKEDFILAELNNSVRYFKKIFGDYPYETFGATFHPYGFGQGFPSMLMIPNTDRSTKYTYSFISHETAHQWWGNIVAWRSYRDQWLSEGFAEYSGVLYTALRENPKAAEHLIDEMRTVIRQPPRTLTGTGSGKLNDVGPIILGHRLDTRKTIGGYNALIYNKGALVLRMLHMLFTDPNSGDGKAFFDMMKAFVEKFRNSTASTDDFRIVANERFAQTPIAKEYGLPNLNWFFQQWVYETYLPSYSLEYQIDSQSDGSVLLSGNVIQENVPDNFLMVLPLRMKFGGDKFASSTVLAYGPKTPFKLKLPMRPTGVELDPQSWVLSEKTSTK